MRQHSLIMSSVDAAAAPTATATSRETEESPLESIWDCAETKKIVDPITYKAKMEYLHCGVEVLCNATKLAHHATKNKGGEIRACAAAHSDCHTKLHNDLFINNMDIVTVRKSYARQEVKIKTKINLIHVPSAHRST